jgi:death-on-curing protein
MKTPRWILPETVELAHEALLAAHGGSAGIRDGGMLDSALSRPQNLFFYDSPSLFDLAAAYAFGIVKNHPFVDGNKRTGFAMAVLFLELNGYNFNAAEADATVQTLALAAGAMDEAQYAAWLKTNATARR